MIDARIHIGNVRDNLQMIANFACATTTLLVPTSEGLLVFDCVRPITVLRSTALYTVGSIVGPDEMPEAYACWKSGEIAVEAKTSSGGGIEVISYAHPIGVDGVYGVVVRDVLCGVLRDFGTREESFVQVAVQLLKQFRRGVLRDAVTHDPFSTTHSTSDDVMCLGSDRTVLYATSNMRSIFPGTIISEFDRALQKHSLYEQGVVLALSNAGCSQADIDIEGVVLSVRVLPLNPGAVVLMEDVSELRARERELRVKEATIREVHHRVKNNLQTIESLLRMQIRRTESAEVKDAFNEAISRVGAMAIAHEMLSYASDESVEVAPLVRAVAQRVRDGLAGSRSRVTVCVEGDAGFLDARGSSSFSLSVAEIVHNAIEHGLEGCACGCVLITLAREQGVLAVDIEDDGCGLSSDFSLEQGNSMGLVLMRTLVEDDLMGEITCGQAFRLTGARFSIRVPVACEK